MSKINFLEHQDFQNYTNIKCCTSQCAKKSRRRAVYSKMIAAVYYGEQGLCQVCGAENDGRDKKCMTAKSELWPVAHEALARFARISARNTATASSNSCIPRVYQRITRSLNPIRTFQSLHQDQPL